MVVSMRIAEIAPPWFTVPPAAYGGIELVVSLLADGLTARGHDVTLVASGGSETKAALATPLDKTPEPALLGNVWFEAFHALVAYLQAASFDVIHDHSGVVGPALGSLLGGRPPVVHTLHGPWTEPARRYYRLLDERVHLVAVSNAQRDDFPELRYAAVVRNGIDVDAYPFSDRKDDYLIFIGRANPDKGPAQAIEVARRARIPLIMVVKKQEPFEVSYWDEMVAPLVTDEVEVLEELDHTTKVRLLAGARALIFPIQWAEPFGLVMVEAMACGTPVIACPAGAAVEIVEEGTNGFLRHSVDELAEVVARADECSPAACRARVAQDFSASAMVDAYERLFRSLTR
jgi:glycosyltransferase involved in cell wall biosynthesis